MHSAVFPGGAKGTRTTCEIRGNAPLAAETHCPKQSRRQFVTIRDTSRPAETRPAFGDDKLRNGGVAVQGVAFGPQTLVRWKQVEATGHN
jgi:hypothetical protein